MESEQTEQTITGNILQKARENTEHILARKNLSRTDRVNFENQQLILMFIETNHVKTTKMYQYYEKQIEQRNRLLSWQNAVIVYVLADIARNIVQYLSSSPK